MDARRRVCAALWAAALLTSFLVSFREVRRTGDGLEYLLYARALSAHLSPDVREADLDFAGGLLEQSEPGIRQVIQRRIDGLGAAPSGPGGARYWGGLVRTADGALYAWHFWLYPALVAPLLELVRRLGLPPLYAFVLFNWVCASGALLYMATRWEATSWPRHVLAALFLCTGTTYYARWTHPEVFTASLILLALMLLSDRRPGPAMLASAAASAQNPPALILLAYAATVAVLQARRSRSASSSPAPGVGWRRGDLLLALAALGVASAPFVFFHAVAGVPNPIVAAGSAETSLISLSRLWSLYFDLSQGMVVGAPGVLLGVAAMPLLVARARRAEGRAGGARQPLLPLLVGVSLSVAMAVPSLATRNWNSGQAVFMRYAYWLAVPIVFGLVAAGATLPRRWRTGLAMGVVGIQVATVASHRITGASHRPYEQSLNPVAACVLRNFPELYNPVPEVFVERVLETPSMPRVVAGGRRAFVYPTTGEPTKALLPSGQAEAIAVACATGSPTEVEGGWAYLTLRGRWSCVSEMLPGR